MLVLVLSIIFLVDTNTHFVFFFNHFYQIVHLKRFQFVNGRWIKSQKIVKFPRESFDPSAFLAPRDLEQRCLHSRSQSEDLLRVGEDNLSSISAPAGFCNLPKGNIFFSLSM